MNGPCAIKHKSKQGTKELCHFYRMNKLRSIKRKKLSDIQMITHRCQSIKIDLLNLANPRKNKKSHRPPTPPKNHQIA